jgi:hypothetical protein
MTPPLARPLASSSRLRKPASGALPALNLPLNICVKRSTK